MAEFLIKKTDNTNPDNTKNLRGCYKAGDIIQVFDNGKCIEAPAPDSPFYIIKVPAIDLTETKAENWERAGLFRRRRFYVNISLLPDIRQTELTNTRWTTVTRLAFRAAVVDRGLNT